MEYRIQFRPQPCAPARGHDHSRFGWDPWREDEGSLVGAGNRLEGHSLTVMVLKRNVDPLAIPALVLPA